MMKRIGLIFFSLLLSAVINARNVTVHVEDCPAESVFRDIMVQTGKNFVYSSDLLKGIKVTVNACDRPLKKVLADMFRGYDIEFRIKGNDVILKSKSRRLPRSVDRIDTPSDPKHYITVGSRTLEEVTVVSRLGAAEVETSEIGAKKLTAADVRSTPVLFGESDVVKTLLLQPGVSEGTEGMAGMNVHGGNSDENLYMLDNIPLYHVNHLGGLFSAFNSDAIEHIDFFKSSVPAKYDGRLSSFMDVRTRNGSQSRHHGSAKLGLTSGAFDISGPIGHRTTYLCAVRRSWLDVLTIPFLAIVNTGDQEKIRFHYYFMDLNAKLNHRFSKRLSGYASVYFGDDMLRTGTKEQEQTGSDYYEDKYDFHWGNLVVQAGVNYRLSTSMAAEFTAAYTRYFSGLGHEETDRTKNNDLISTSRIVVQTDNNINDWIGKADFEWKPMDVARVRFGGNYILHSFLPSRTTREHTRDETVREIRDSTWAYRAGEVNLYIEDDWTICPQLRANVGLHASLFHIGGKFRYGLAPRMSVSYRPNDNWAVKCAYARTTQYVHQLTQSYMALPTDQWIPVTGNFRPQTADKVSVGAYWQSSGGDYSLSLEGYYKYMRNLLEYSDEYYLRLPLEIWNSRLTTGKGTAKGIDLKVEKTMGRLTGHLAYSLGWTDRTFKEKNGGHRYPARFDHRHTVNVALVWKANDKIQLNAVWIGHSGNRFTLLPQVWEAPGFGPADMVGEAPLKEGINNYQLPFYHRLDISCMVRNRRGYWTFGLYNAYCHKNVVAIRRNYTWNGRPVFQKVSMLPLIPSISYTWQF